MLHILYLKKYVHTPTLKYFTVQERKVLQQQRSNADTSQREESSTQVGERELIETEQQKYSENVSRCTCRPIW